MDHQFTHAVLSVNRFIKNATVNSGREGRICERPKMIGWSLSQAGAPEMGISEEGASSLLHGTALTDNTLVCLLFTAMSGGCNGRHAFAGGWNTCASCCNRLRIDMRNERPAQLPGLSEVDDEVGEV